MLNSGEIRDILSELVGNSKQHAFYKEAIDIAKEIADTFSDKYPDFLELDRPKETKAVKEYRKKVYRNPVKGDLSRIVGKFSKIEQSEGFSINFKTPENGSNPLEAYTKQNFNGYNSLLHWTFSSVINTYVADPNAVIAIFDKNPPELETQQSNPYPYLFSSDQVIKFKKGKYCALKEQTEDGDPRIFYVIDDTYTYIFTETNGEKFTFTRQKHNCPLPPFFKIGQHIKEEKGGEQLYKSTISDAIPHFISAIRRANDIEIEYNHHVSTREWSITPRQCKTCRGSGKLQSKDREAIVCNKCKGHGHEPFDTLETLKIDPQDDILKGEVKFPFNSPGGFIPRNIESVKAMETAVDRHIDRAYETIDFGEVLREKRGLSAESGQSKQYDRLEYSQKIYNEGLHIVENIMMPVYRAIDAQKFGYDETMSRVPDITVSISYDVMSPETILAEIEKMKKAGITGRVIGELVARYNKIVIGEDAKTTKMELDEMLLNPQYGRSIEDLELLYGGGEDSPTNAISTADFILAANFKGFYDRALREHIAWESFDEIQKDQVLRGYLEERIKEREAKIKTRVNLLGVPPLEEQYDEQGA